MQKKVWIFIIIVILAIILGGAFLWMQKPKTQMTNVQSDTEQGNKSCLDTAATQYDFNICAGNLAEAADAKLNILYQKISVQLDAKSKNQLIITEQAWIKYRDENCKVPRIFSSAGSGAGADVSICIEELTNDRIQELKNLYDGQVETEPGTENINPNE